MIPQFFKFVAIGAINTVVGLSVICAAIYFFSINPIVANAVGYLVGIGLSFILNAKMTFRQESLSRHMFVRFVVICLIAYIVNVAAVWVGLAEGKYAAQVIGMALYTLVSFFGSRLFVFSR
jgi:putative flippase GtrA